MRRADAIAVDSTWRDTLDMYCDKLASEGSEQHAEQHRRRVVYFMDTAGLDAFDQITPRHAALWVASLREHGQPHPNGRRRPCGPKTLQTHAATMNAMWVWLVVMEVVPAKGSPFSTLRLPSAPKTKKRAFTAAEVGRLIHAAVRDENGAGAERDEEGVILCRSTLYWTISVVGLRLSEAMRVRWRHVSLGNPPELLVIGHKGKNRADQAYTLPPDLGEAIRMARVDGGSESDPVWPAIADRSKSAALRLLRRDARRAGIDERDEEGRLIGWHSFRRFTATELLRQGVDIGTVQKVMRHASPSTTISHYNDVRRENIDAAQTTLGSVVTGHIPGRATGNIDKGLDGGGEISDTEDAKSDHNDPINERGPPQSPPDFAIAGEAVARSLPQGADRAASGGRWADPGTKGVTGSSPVSPIRAPGREQAIDRLLTAASDLLAAAAELSRSAPGRGAEDGGRQISR